MPALRLATALLLATGTLLAAAPLAAHADDGTEGSTSLGYGWFTHTTERGPRTDHGLAAGLRVESRVAPHVGAGLSFTWGLADWPRAKEWIAAGNRAGSWTTDKLAQVEAWATKKDAREDTRGLRYLGMGFADLFLLMTYVAVPACYVGSVGGATSYLQLDATGTLHLAQGGAADAWLEGGLGGATLPYRIVDWRGAFGPVGGVGMRVGPLTVRARVLWSPSIWNEAPYGGRLVMGGLTLTLGER